MYMEKVRALGVMEDKGPRELQSREDVASMLHIPDRKLRYILFGKRPENMYHSFQIAKNSKSPKSGSTNKRQIDAPDPQLKAIQRTLATYLDSIYIKRKAVYGFIPKRNHVMNAKIHVHSRYLLNIDLKDYFKQFHFGRIVGTLTHPPYNMGKEAAITIAQISCLNGILPQGAPTSPVITNMVSAPLDSALTRLANKYNLLYTRYADDITFSSRKREIPAEIVHWDPDGIFLGPELLEIFSKHNFEINTDKVTLHAAFQRQEVTGIVVNKKLNLKREYLKVMRSILHNCLAGDVYTEAKKYATSRFCHSRKLQTLISNGGDSQQIQELFRRILWGKLNYIRSVRGENDELFLELAEQYNEIFDVPEFPHGNFGCPREQLQKTVILMCKDQNNEMISQGSGFYLKDRGVLTCQHVIDCAYTHIQVVNLYDSGDNSNYNLTAQDAYAVSKEKDYAIFVSERTLQIPYFYKEGDSRAIAVGQPVWLVSYPEYLTTHRTAQVLHAKVTQQKTKFGIPFYTVDKRVVHGSSGGVVLNSRFEAIGMIRGGSSGDTDEAHESESGFTPLYIILEGN